jgi:CBS domain-containing protein
MTGSVITVTPDHSVEDCMKMITEHRVRHLPVLAGDKLLGVISIGDLVNAIILEQAETIGHLHTYISCNASHCFPSNVPRYFPVESSDWRPGE